MKTFKTKRAMMMAAKRLEAALNERLKMFSEPATVEIEDHPSNFVSVEVRNKNSYILTLVEVNVMVGVANKFFANYDERNWFIKIDTTPMYCAGTESFLHLPTLVIELIGDDLIQNK